MHVGVRRGGEALVSRPKRRPTSGTRCIVPHQLLWKVHPTGYRFTMAPQLLVRGSEVDIVP